MGTRGRGRGRGKPRFGDYNDGIDLTKALFEAQAVIDAKDTEIRNLRRELSERRDSAEVRSLQGQVDRLKSLLSSKEIDNEVLQKRMDSIQMSGSELYRQYQMRGARIKELEKELERLKGRDIGLKSMLEALEEIKRSQQDDNVKIVEVG